jgi:type VI secretion system FHA domain protein
LSNAAPRNGEATGGSPAIPDAPAPPNEASSLPEAPPREGARVDEASPLSAALRADMVSLRVPSASEEPAGVRALDPVAMLRQRAAAGRGPSPRQPDNNAALLGMPPGISGAERSSPPTRQAFGSATAARPGIPLAQPDSPHGEDADVASNSEKGGAEAFWQGLGLDPARLPPQAQTEILAECGRALREAVVGLVPVLSARRSLKDELRMDQTRLQPKENNPLKFLPSGEAVLQALVDRKLTGFLPLSQAVREGFGDIKAHEVAALVALDAVIKNLLARFDPASFEAPGTSGKLFGRGPDKSKLWENFVRLHAALSGNLEETTRKVVGEEFANAYAKQVALTRNGGG